MKSYFMMMVLKERMNLMARAMNYEKKMAAIEEKISKKQAELKKLQDELKDLRLRNDQEQGSELFDLIYKKGLTVSEVMGWVRNYNQG